MWTDGTATAATVDTTRAGLVIDVQTDAPSDGALDQEIREHIADTLARRQVAQQLDAIERQQFGRSDRLRGAA